MWYRIVQCRPGSQSFEPDRAGPGPHPHIRREEIAPASATDTEGLSANPTALPEHISHAPHDPLCFWRLEC